MDNLAVFNEINLVFPVLCEVEASEELGVELDSLLDFGDFDVFVGSVTAAALSGAHLEAGAGEQSLVTHGGTAVGGATEFNGAAHKGVFGADSAGL